VKKILPLEIGKWLSVLVLLAFLVISLSANHVSQAAFSSVQEAVISQADASNMQQADSQMIRRLYGLDPTDYEDILLYCPTTNMGAEELLLVKLKDTSQQDTVTAAIEKRVATQMDSFDGYGVDQYDMLEKSVTEVQGNYILLVVATDPTPVRQAFLDAL
jgi:hypothetical protein